jgi:hypothetical protein
MMKMKRISQEYFRRFWQLFEEGRAEGLTPILHCSDCRAEIIWSCEKTIKDDGTIDFNPAKDITEGLCGCSTLKIDT